MSDFVPGLEGVVAFETEIAEPDREGGSLRYRGVDIKDLVGRVSFGNAWGLLVDNKFNPGLLHGGAPARVLHMIEGVEKSGDAPVGPVRGRGLAPGRGRRGLGRGAGAGHRQLSPRRNGLRGRSTTGPQDRSATVPRGRSATGWAPQARAGAGH